MGSLNWGNSVGLLSAPTYQYTLADCWVAMFEFEHLKHESTSKHCYMPTMMPSCLFEALWPKHEFWEAMNSCFLAEFCAWGGRAAGCESNQRFLILLEASGLQPRVQRRSQSWHRGAQSQGHPFVKLCFKPWYLSEPTLLSILCD